VHLEEHRMQQKQPEYQRIKLENFAIFSQREMSFAKHNEQHQKFLAQQMAAQDKRMAKVVELRKGAKTG